MTHMQTVPPQAYAFLAVVGAFLCLLLIFFLYLNKKLCFSSVGGFPCIDKPVARKQLKEIEGGTGSKTKKRQDIGAYVYEEETSSDSEDEVLRRLQQSMSIHASQRSKLARTDSYKITQNTHTDDETTTSFLELKESTPSHSLSALQMQTADWTESEGEESFCMSSLPDTPAATAEASHQQQQQQHENGQEFTIGDLEMSGARAREQTAAVLVNVLYQPQEQQLTVQVICARDIPSKEGGTNSQMRVVILPNKRQAFRTKIIKGSSPQFHETFTFNKLCSEEMRQDCSLRFRAFALERMRREKLIGECSLVLSNLKPNSQFNQWLELRARTTDLTPRQMSNNSAGSTTCDGAELFLGLAYNGTTGRLLVEVIKGSHFRSANTSQRAPDTYVKLSLMSVGGAEIARSKTSLRKCQPNPLFKETFIFQVALFQLADVTLMVSVYSRRSMKRKEMLGWFSLGLNSSGEEELSHWNDMKLSAQTVSRWHSLLDA